MQTVAVVDLGSGNLRSVERAALQAAADANRRREVRVTAEPDFVRRADKIILPGQGAFAAVIGALGARAGLIEALEEAVLRRGAAFLGICVGMQILGGRGLEHGETKGLGWIGGDCAPLEAGSLPLPHMGWSPIHITQSHPVLGPAGEGPHFYFAHSFALAPPAATIAAEAAHGARFTAAVARGHLLGVQFHPEKSQRAGLALLARFMDWTPA